MKADTPHRFVQKAIDLIEVGAEISDTTLDDYAVGIVQSNPGLKQYLGDRFARLVGADVSVLAIDDELTVQSEAAAVDPAKVLALLQLLLSLWGQFRK